MVTSLLIALVIALILLGLYKSTESVLDIRQERRDRGEDTCVYL